MALPAEIRPASQAELCDAVREAAAGGGSLLLQGGGSKSQAGAPTPLATRVDMRAFSGVIDYDPAELVLTVGAGTPLHDIEQLLAGENQMLAFEPFDLGPLYGAAAGRSTIGGLVMAGIAGSRRLSAGNVRDHVLAVDAVSGRAERFVAGARVVKNVTGYDLPKLLCGSWGRLAAVTQLTLKVLPRGRASSTRIVSGLCAGDAIALMAQALGSQAEVAAAAFLPAQGSQSSQTALRLEGFGPSVDSRGRTLDALLSAAGAVSVLESADATAWWQRLRTLPMLSDGAALWRISVAPSRAAALLASLESLSMSFALDWAGALVWLSCDERSLLPRELAARAGGHAMLLRGPASQRSRVPMLQPLAAGVAALEQRLRRAFDPQGVFETGRFGSAVTGVAGEFVAGRAADRHAD